MQPNNRKCCVEFCQNTGKNCDLTFFLIPREDPAKAEKWMKTLKLKPNLPQKKYVCSDHFEEKYFTSTFKRHLNPFAFPTLQFKSPKVEGTTWDKCKESQYLCKNSTSNSESSKDVLPGPKEASVVATLHLESENGRQIQVLSASTNADTKTTGKNCPTIKETIDDCLKLQALKRKAIEEEIDDYLKRRYHNETNRKAFEQMLKEHQYKKPKKEYFNKSKEKSGNFDRIVIKTEDSNSSVENQPSEEENAVVMEQLGLRTHPKQSVNFLPILKQNINSRNISEKLSEKQSSNHMFQTQLQTKSGSVSELETGDVYDKFAARIAEELKRMKNPYRRAKTLFYIERILYEAKSGAYDA